MKKIILSLVFVTAFATLAYGYHGGRGGYGYGHGGGYCGNGYYNDRGRGRGDGYGRHGRGYDYDRNYSQYNNGYSGRYSDADRAKIDAVYQKYDAQMEKLRSDMFAKSSELRVAYSEAKPDQAKIESILDERAKIGAEMQKLRLKIDMEVDDAVSVK